MDSKKELTFTLYGEPLEELTEGMFSKQFSTSFTFDF